MYSQNRFILQNKYVKKLPAGLGCQVSIELGLPQDPTYEKKAAPYGEDVKKLPRRLRMKDEYMYLCIPTHNTYI